MTDRDKNRAEIDLLHEKLRADAESGGYHLNPDVEFTMDLVEGLVTNEKRYGYPSCPCRLASGKKKGDLDIICPCDYRDADLNDHDTCYCGLYVSKRVVEGKKEIGKIPERRPPHRTNSGPELSVTMQSLPYPIWRCRVCGYLCARKEPPEVCPVCKAGKERFELFIPGPS
ncbi:MAG: ferredoxin:glutaredoxin reductase [candidate division WOR-3 bacterium]|nr:MAG: ferredoxin:glutaredoxin reductase [candidate division WOR-3 bacterium]